jgi:hypothetical protein
MLDYQQQQQQQQQQDHCLTLLPHGFVGSRGFLFTTKCFDTSWCSITTWLHRKMIGGATRAPEEGNVHHAGQYQPNCERIPAFLNK